MIKEVKATFACDRCDQEFSVKVDPAINPPADWAVYDIAVDAIRSLLNYEDSSIPIGESLLGGSVDANGNHYCQRCTDRKRKKVT